MSEKNNIRYDLNWKEKYKDMIFTPEQAIGRIRRGQRVFISTGCSVPATLVRVLAQKHKDLSDVEILHLLTFGDAPYAKKELIENFSVNSFFIGENVREIIQEGLGQYTPIYLVDIPRLLGSGQLPLDVALIQVTPPDENGMVSLGISVDIVKSAAENASLVIAQVNPNMPWTHGESLLNIYDLDILVPCDEPLIELPRNEPTEVSRRIGEFVAPLVEDGSTIEIGIGRIPQMVLEFLKDKKDLGLHTEMFSDAIIDLIEAGVINGKSKTIDRGKAVTSFCVGTKKVYDYVDNNPKVAFHPTEYINDGAIISRQNKMVAINMALEVDLTGQVCADSLGTKFYSGIGGQVDFNSGASRSIGGRAIITLPSTAKDGKISRIVTRLAPGAGVVTTRGGVHYIVTEYGVAYLHGKTISERVMALISIAHPDFREKLLKEAIEAKYLRPEMADVGGTMIMSVPESKTSMVLNDGTQINFRSVRPTDGPLMKELLYALSEETIYYRFMSNMRQILHQQIQNFVYFDYRTDAAIVGTVPEAYGEEFVALGRYYLDQKTNRAEVAFIVRDGWHNRGIGRFMFQYLVTIARRNGISGFTAEVLRENKSMQAIFNNSNLKVKSHLSEGVFHFDIDLV